MDTNLNLFIEQMLIKSGRSEATFVSLVLLHFTFSASNIVSLHLKSKDLTRNSVCHGKPTEVKQDNETERNGNFCHETTIETKDCSWLWPFVWKKELV